MLTQRYNNKRTGANLQEYVLTVEAVGSSEFQKLYAVPVAGQVYAQPLLVPQVKWTDGTTKNLLVVATMQNMVEVFQVDDAIHGPAFSPIHLWSQFLAQPVPANFMPMSGSAMGICQAGICLLSDDPPSSPPPLPPVGTAPTATNKLGFYNINPWIGIVSTPVIDPVSQTIYLVCKLVGTDGAIFSRLFALDLLTGKVLRTIAIGVPPEDTFAEVPATSSDSKGIINRGLEFSPRMHMNRPALLLQNGRIYIAFGSHQDTRPWHGWLFSYDAKTFQRTAVWCSTPNGMAGGVWQAGGGIAGADDGRLYVMTGNGDEDPDGSGEWKSSNASLNNFGTHFVQFDPDLKVLGSFAPSNAVQMDKDDVDLGSSGPVLFPENSNGNILFGGGKDSRLFVLDSNTNLGMRQIFQAGAPPDGINFGGVMADHHIHGSPVLWRSSRNGMNLYVWPERDFLRKFHWNDNAAVLDCKNKSGTEEKCQDGDSPIQQSAIPSPGFCSTISGPVLFCPWSMPGGILSLSADGNAAGTGVIWASMPKDADALANVVPGELHALDADDITHEVWNSEMHPARDGNFLFAKYNPPVIANGRVYMATFSNLVNVYGLRQWAKYIGNVGTPPPPALNSGKTFTTQVTMLNTGTTVWKKGAFRLGSQSPQDNSTWGKNRFELPKDVNPGDQATFSLTLTAPSQMVPGCQQDALGRALCDYQWRMVEENVEWFGEPSPKLTITVVIPLTPRQCTAGLQCCEKDSKGNCTLCAKVCR